MCNFNKKSYLSPFLLLLKTEKGTSKKTFIWGLLQQLWAPMYYFSFRSTNLFDFIPSHTFWKTLELDPSSISFCWIMMIHLHIPPFLYSFNNIYGTVQIPWHEFKGIIVKDTWTCFWKINKNQKMYIQITLFLNSHS